MSSVAISDISETTNESIEKEILQNIKNLKSAKNSLLNEIEFSTLTKNL